MLRQASRVWKQKLQAREEVTRNKKQNSDRKINHFRKRKWNTKLAIGYGRWREKRTTNKATTFLRHLTVNNDTLTVVKWWEEKKCTSKSWDIRKHLNGSSIESAEYYLWQWSLIIEKYSTPIWLYGLLQYMLERKQSFGSGILLQVWQWQMWLWYVCLLLLQNLNWREGVGEK